MAAAGTGRSAEAAVHGRHALIARRRTSEEQTRRIVFNWRKILPDLKAWVGRHLVSSAASDNRLWREVRPGPSRVPLPRSAHLGARGSGGGGGSGIFRRRLATCETRDGTRSVDCRTSRSSFGSEGRAGKRAARPPEVRGSHRDLPRLAPRPTRAPTPLTLDLFTRETKKTREKLRRGWFLITSGRIYHLGFVRAQIPRRDALVLLGGTIGTRPAHRRRRNTRRRHRRRDACEHAAPRPTPSDTPT